MANTINTPAQRRVCMLLDVDAFEVQVYKKMKGILHVGGLYVVANSKNRITAVSYEAKKVGISRDNTPYLTSKLRQQYPTLHVLRIPTRKSGKPDMATARKATQEIITAIRHYFNEMEDHLRPIFEYSSRDEFFMDFSAIVADMNMDNEIHGWMIKSLWPKTIIETKKGPVNVGSGEAWRHSKPEDIDMFYGVVLASELVKTIKEKTGFQVSIGVGPNKLLAKLACGHNKPAAVTAFPRSGFSNASRYVKIQDIPKFGGEMGKSIMQNLALQNEEGEERSVESMADLKYFTVEEFAIIPASVDSARAQRSFGERQAGVFYRLVRGICDEPVEAKEGPNSISCSSNFSKKEDMSLHRLWTELLYLIEELLERSLEEQMLRQREPITIKASVKPFDGLQISQHLDYSSDSAAEEIVDNLMNNFHFNPDTWCGKIKSLEVLGKPFRLLEEDFASLSIS